MRSAFVSVLLLLLTGCAYGKGALVCRKDAGVAVVESMDECQQLSTKNFTTSQVDLEDPYMLHALAHIREIVSNVDLEPIDIPGGLKAIAEDEVISEIGSKGMASVYEIGPDFADSLGINTYKVVFRLESADNVILLVDVESGRHEWGIRVE